MNEAADYTRSFEVPTGAEPFSSIHRFGHTRDFSRLFAASPQEQKDYVWGLLFVGGFMLVVFLAWMLWILIFCCLGQERVGFLSGAPFHRNVQVEELSLIQPDMSFERAWEDLDDDDDDYDYDQRTEQAKAPNYNPGLNDYHEGNAWDKRPTRIRLLFSCSGLVFITFAILAVTQGLVNLESTAVTVNESFHDIDVLAQEAKDIIDSGIREVRSLAVSVRDLLVEELSEGNLCPGDPSALGTETAKEIEEKAQQAIPLLEELGDFVASNIDEIEQAAQDISSAANDVTESTDNIDFTSWQAFVILLPFTIIPSLLLAGVIMAAYDVEFPHFVTALNWVIFPIFCLLVVFCCVAASLMVMGAAANSDFCLPGGRGETVDLSVKRIILEVGLDNETVEYQIAKHYIDQCGRGQDPFEFIRDYIPQVNASQESVDQFVAYINDTDTKNDLTIHCNRDFENLETLLGSMTELLTVVVDAMGRTLDLVACERIVPIYTNIFYDGTCTYSITAVMWVFSGLLILGVFGLIMMTTRSAYKPTIYTTTFSDHADKAPGTILAGEDVNQEVEPPSVLQGSMTSKQQEPGLESVVPIPAPVMQEEQPHFIQERSVVHDDSLHQARSQERSVPNDIVPGKTIYL